MALLPILRYPDPRLKKTALPVARIDDSIRELVRDGDNGLLLAADAQPDAAALSALSARAEAIAAANRDWVASHAMFAPAVSAFLDRLQALAMR